MAFAARGAARRSRRPRARARAPTLGCAYAVIRDIDDNDDKSMRKGDLTTTGLYHDGKTILDVGITHPTIDTYINNSSSEAPRGSAANIYANNKCRDANKIIADKELDVDFKAITFTTYGVLAKTLMILSTSSLRRHPTTTLILGLDRVPNFMRTLLLVSLWLVRMHAC